MAIVPIREVSDPVLREIAKPVPEELFGTPALTTMLENMADTLDAEADGVAIAAPQVGLSYRIFLVRYDRMKPPQKEGEPALAPELGVYINPEFVRLAKKGEMMEEGCLSVRHRYGKTKRKERATVRAYDAEGKEFERGAGGILAQAFQHEIDHLNGILFIDHATDMVEITDEEMEKTRAERRKKREERGDYDTD